MNMNQGVMPQSSLLTLKDIVDDDLRFEVPIYQRLYVWGADQVRTLMDDLLSACKRQTPIYYLGGTLVMRRGDGADAVLDLIDGQQRFTTLWLIAQVWGQQSEDLRSFLQVTRGNTVCPRLSFAIREVVNQYFGQGLAKPQHAESGFQADKDGLKSILDAQKEIRRYLDDEKEYGVTPVQFSHFLLHNVRIVQTEVPANTDLNKLFEVINNRGVQLQHHEILKARMLRVLESEGAADPQSYQSYAWLWDACAGMNGYVERNLARLTNRSVAALFDSEGESGKGEALANAGHVLAHLKSKEHKAVMARAPQSLADILGAAPTAGAEAAKPDTGVKAGTARSETEPTVDEARPVRSIFGFSVLLQHVLRIWLQCRAEGCDPAVEDLDRVADKDLLDIFDRHFFNRKPAPDDVRSFIELLWELRYLFDKFVIKWATPGDEEIHLIRKLRRNASDGGGSLARDWEEPESLRAFSLLQSMLYHSQQITTQYWVTPLLAFLHRQAIVSPEICTAFLQHLDNHLICTSDASPLIARSRAFLGANPWAEGTPNCGTLTAEPLGVGFPHYWFYKLEYVLWHRFTQKTGNSAEWARSVITEEKLKRFRITARNSVEHVFPQTPQANPGAEVTETWLDAFGNLALVSRSLNSEFGNKPFAEKRERFKRLNHDRLDSIKSALIYGHDQWGDDEVQAHQNAMIRILEEYLNPKYVARVGTLSGKST